MHLPRRPAPALAVALLCTTLLLACTSEGPRILDTTRVGDTRNNRGPYDVATVVVDDESPIDGVWLHYTLERPDRVEGHTVPMHNAHGGRTWRGSIPGQPSGTHVRYWIEASDEASLTARDPAAAPAHAFEFVVGQSEPASLVPLPGSDASGDAPDDGSGAHDGSDLDLSETHCANAFDDDGDGQVDCADDDCADLEACRCGNGEPDEAEDCDDGNRADGDGCSSACELESSSCGAPIVLEETSYRVAGERWRGVSDDLVLDAATCPTRTDGQGEMIFQVALRAGQVAWLSEHDRIDVSLSVLSGACGPLVPCAMSVTDDEARGLYYVAARDETIFLVVEAWPVSTSRPYDIRIEVQTPVCGDGELQFGETCDHGNRVPGDGCDAQCQLEPSSCESPIQVGPDGGRFTGGSWSEVEDDLVLGGEACLERGGGRGDLVFEVALAAGQVVLARSLETEDDVVLSVLAEGCSGVAPCASSERVTSAEEVVVYAAPAAQTVYVVAEPYGSDAGHFDIELEVITPVCGDGALEPGETCEDGNAAPGDGCSALCRVEPSSCEAPIRVGPSGGRFTGLDWSDLENTLVLEPETCDARLGENAEMVFEVMLTAGQVVRVSEHGAAYVAMSVLAGSCSAETPCATSGDGDETRGRVYRASTAETVYVVVEAAYSYENDPFDVLIEILSPICGDGVLEPGESCDDGNGTAGDGCDPACRIEPSSCASPIRVGPSGMRLVGATWSEVEDAVVLDGVTCDSRVNGNGELVFEIPLTVGQALRVSEHGEADVVLSVLPGACGPSATCAVSRETYEADGVTWVAQSSETVYAVVEGWSSSEDDPFDVLIEVVTPVCRNGVHEPGEGCDDGNGTPGDGCDALCRVEPSSCASPIRVAPPGGRFVGPDWSVHDDTLELDAVSCRERDSGQREMVFEIALEANQTVVVSEHSPTDVVLSVLSSACATGASCLRTRNGDETGGIAHTASGAETIFVVVEAWYASESGPFDVRVEYSGP